MGGQFLRGLLTLFSFTFLNLIFFFVFLGPHLQNMEVPRLRVESELQLHHSHSNAGSKLRL